jgi:hypothetical protein
VDDLIVYLHEAKSVPLSGNAMVDRERHAGEDPGRPARRAEGGALDGAGA